MEQEVAEVEGLEELGIERKEQPQTPKKPKTTLDLKPKFKITRDAVQCLNNDGIKATDFSKFKSVKKTHKGKQTLRAEKLAKKSKCRRFKACYGFANFREMQQPFSHFRDDTMLLDVVISSRYHFYLLLYIYILTLKKKCTA